MRDVNGDSDLLVLLFLFDGDLLPLSAAGLAYLVLVDGPLEVVDLLGSYEHQVAFLVLHAGGPVGEGCEDAVLVGVHDDLPNVGPALHGGVGSGERFHLPVLDLDDAGANGVQEVPVVGDGQDGARVIHQGLLDGMPGGDVEVVGGLV